MTGRLYSRPDLVSSGNRQSRGREAFLPNIGLAEFDAVTGAGDLADEMDAAANDSIVRWAVALLPPKYRDAIVVYYFKQQDLAIFQGALQSWEDRWLLELHALLERSDA